MRKKMYAFTGLMIATAAGAGIMSSPASAVTPAWGGGGWGFSRHSVFSRQGNFNANENALFNRIRLRIRNRNNNVAINNQRQREQQRQFEEERPSAIFTSPPVGAPV